MDELSFRIVVSEKRWQVSRATRTPKERVVSGEEMIVNQGRANSCWEAVALVNQCVLQEVIDANA